MKRATLAVLVVLCLASTVLAEITITTPTEKLEAGRHYLLPVNGLSATDLARTVVIVEPKETTSAVGVTGWGGEQYLWFNATDNGRRFIVVIVGGMGKPVTASLMLDIGNSSPDPPPPPPPLPGELTIVVVYESENRTPQETLVILGLRDYLIKSNVAYRLVDQHLKDRTGRAPKWFQAPRTFALKVGLPCLVIGVINPEGVFSVVDAKPLPDTIEGAIKLVKPYRDKQVRFTPKILIPIKKYSEVLVCTL